MNKSMHNLLAAIAFTCVATAHLAVGQNATPVPTAASAQPQFQCDQEKTAPFALYCDRINDFLNAVSDPRNRDSTGQIDRGRVHHFLTPILKLDTDDQFITSVASRVAFQDAIDSLPSFDNPDTTTATLSSLSQNRPDQQTSATSNASGTTSLVEKAGAPAVLAFALESGALTRSVSGNTATLSANADGLFRALTGMPVLCFECKTKNGAQGPLGTRLLRNLNLSAAFLIDQSSTSTASTAGAANSSTPSSLTNVLIPSRAGKLSSFSAKYEVWNPYDPRSAKFLDAWDKAVAAADADIKKSATSFHSTLKTLLVDSPLDHDAKFQEFLNSYSGIFYKDAEDGDLAKLKQDFLIVYNTTLDTWSRDDPKFNQRVAAVNEALAQYQNLWSQILEKAKGQPLLTFEYTFSKPQMQPETHDFSLILGYTPRSAVGLLSVNAAISVYGGTMPAGAKYGRLHDGQISAEYDRPVSIKGNSNQGTFSLAAYWQYQPDPSVLNITSGNLAPGTNIQLPQDAQVLLGTAGSQWVTQAKFTINAKSGIKIPFAVKWANKTDLLSGNKVGAQVGITYDFSSLSSLFGGSARQ